MKRKVFFLFSLFLMTSMYFAWKDTAHTVPQNNITVVKAFAPAEIQGFQFLQAKMQSSQGLIYYLVEERAPASYSVLESIGQAMEYTALTGDRKMFEYYADIAERYFKDPSGYYYWKIDVATKQGEPASAFVDDLRLVKAYFIASERKLGNYDRQLEKVAETIFKFDIDANGFPCEYYDGKAKQKAAVVPLFYLDVETLKKLSHIHNRWLAPYNHAKNILLHMPDNRYGFYPITFNIKTKQYVWGPSINMVENLYTALDAYAAGKDTRPLVSFLKKQVKKGKIYNHYHLNGAAADQNESTAVYALAARFLALNSEHEAASWCYHRTLQFQIGDTRLFQGGFGESETGLVYAFDQLEALLMLRMVETKHVSQ